jgi:hypothetical protein
MAPKKPTVSMKTPTNSIKKAMPLLSIPHLTNAPA